LRKKRLLLDEGMSMCLKMKAERDGGVMLRRIGGR